MNNETKPENVLALEQVFGKPSQDGFGSAVFFEQRQQNDDLETVAKNFYQIFVGDLWERWGAEAWMSPWKLVYARESGVKPDIVSELQAINDPNASLSILMILDAVEDPSAAGAALAKAYDAPDVVELRLFNIGDGAAMSGLLLAGRSKNGQVICLVFLMD